MAARRCRMQKPVGANAGTGTALDAGTGSKECSTNLLPLLHSTAQPLHKHRRPLEPSARPSVRDRNTDRAPSTHVALFPPRATIQISRRRRSNQPPPTLRISAARFDVSFDGQSSPTPLQRRRVLPIRTPSCLLSEDRPRVSADTAPAEATLRFWP